MKWKQDVERCWDAAVFFLEPVQCERGCRRVGESMYRRRRARREIPGEGISTVQCTWLLFGGGVTTSCGVPIQPCTN